MGGVDKNSAGVKRWGTEYPVASVSAARRSRSLPAAPVRGRTQSQAEIQWSASVERVIIEHHRDDRRKRRFSDSLAEASLVRGRGEPPADSPGAFDPWPRRQWLELRISDRQGLCHPPCGPSAPGDPWDKISPVEAF